MKRVAILASLLLLYPAAAGWAQITGVYGGVISPTYVTSAPGVYYGTGTTVYYAQPAAAYPQPTVAYAQPTVAPYYAAAPAATSGACCTPTTSVSGPVVIGSYGDYSSVPVPTLAPRPAYNPIIAYRPIVPVLPMPNAYYVGRGIIGQPKLYVPGQPVRNALRWISP